MGTESLWQLQVYYLSSKSTFYELLLWEYLGTYTPFAVSIILIFVNRGHLRDIAEKGAFFWFRCAVLMLLTPILQLAEMHAWRHPEMLCRSFKLRAHNPLGSLQHEPWPKDHLADALWMWTQARWALCYLAGEQEADASTSSVSPPISIDLPASWRDISNLPRQSSEFSAIQWAATTCISQFESQPWGGDLQVS